ncbi:hypothetical protein fugu_012515 [Takifugu bimaculatus]|uniref:DH domain-containing protein n=1 Tax=Takifugu bimaculatus TaxID=433685 RepID=A0A4Z2C5K7_9TELE|nr:hypothetical protein fugu_012515 [Takifugu bimaculatus]
MENDKTDTGDNMDASSKGKEENVDEPILEITMLQSLVGELREGLHAALMELSELRQRDNGQEEKLQAHLTEVDDKIMGLKNSLNTFKEELNVALFHIKDISSRQREVQKTIEHLQLENSKDIISVQHRRKCSTADVLMPLGDDHVGEPSQTDLGVIQHLFSSLPHSESTQRSSTSTQTSISEQEDPRSCPSKFPSWGERRSSRDIDASSIETNKRQRVALELLESERVYVSHLSLLLKANISFNGSEAFSCKDKRPFPSSLRFLIQQHLELLHTLQERVLKCQWQSIVGDVFMRLTSKESDFLDFYVSYLREIPECLSVISMLASGSVPSPAFVECDILGDESTPSLHDLLLQPVQRIPEYLLLLQGLLKQTEADHPDYYLLLVCIQQLRSFTAQYHHLLQHNQELLLHNHKEVKRSSIKHLLKTVDNISSPYHCSAPVLDPVNQAKQSKQRLLEQIQSHRFQEWNQEPGPEIHCHNNEWPSQMQFFSPNLDSRKHKLTGLGSIPESEASERSCQHQLPFRPENVRQVQPGFALADALEEFLLPPDPAEIENLYDEDIGIYHDVAMFDRCSSSSSDSSIDIAFVKCPKAPSASPHARNKSTACEVFANSRSQGKGSSRLHNRGCVSPDESIMMRRNQHRPLQASQRKSKSLNGLQMDNTVTALESGPLSDQLQRVVLGSHAKLERQGSKGSKGCPTPSRQVVSPLGNRVDSEKQNDDSHGLLSIDSGFQSWGEESKWRAGTEENHHTPLAERSRKQDKGGFRSSFKKLFKKKGGDEKKDKSGEKTPENQNSGEHDAVVKTAKHLEMNHGTAV